MSGPPDIFYFAFHHERTLEPHFASLGRLLALAQRFESGCKVLSYIVFRRQNPEHLLGGEDEVHRAVRRIYKQRLGQHIEALVGAQQEAAASLNEARKARNEIAHEVALGFEHWLDEPDQLPVLLNHIHTLALALARGDRWVSLVSSILTREPLPTSASLHTYSERFANWVIGKNAG